MSYYTTLFNSYTNTSKILENYFCHLCGCLMVITVINYCNNMAAIPQGAFAAKKVRQNMEKTKNYHDQYNKSDMSPTNYSSKYMNSVWGMYNRYSVHNLKKNFDNAANQQFTIQQQKDSAGFGVGLEKSSGSASKLPPTSISVTTQSLWAFS